MDAQEMFEELGFTLKEKDENYILYEEEVGNHTYFISFFPEKEEFTFGVKEQNDWSKQRVERFDFKIISAITQQIKELGLRKYGGWL